MPLKRFFENEINTFLQYFFNCIITIVTFVRSFFEYKNYHIEKADFIYVRNDIKLLDDITHEYRENGPKSIVDEMSPEVVDFLFRIRYYFNSKKYIYLTRNPNHVFPPKKKGFTFITPIKQAILLDSEDTPLYDVTNHVKMYAGPSHDFHGETIRLRDIEIEHPKLQLVSCLDTVVNYNTKEDEINHQTLWLPSKTLVPQD